MKYIFVAPFLRVPCIGTLVSACMSVTGSAQTPSYPDNATVVQATKLCVEAISPGGFDELGFLKQRWEKEYISNAPNTNFYIKNGIRARLGMRPGVGGSCFLSYNIPDGYDFVELYKKLAAEIPAIPVLGILRLPGKIVFLKAQTEPTGRFQTIAVEILK